MKGRCYMPTISMFYGIIISLYFFDTDKHKAPHIHAKYQDFEAVFSIMTGEILSGSLPPNKLKLVAAWIELRKEDLVADWQLAVTGNEPFKIKPLD